VAAGGRDLEGALGILLPAHLGEVELGDRRVSKIMRGRWLDLRRPLSAQDLDRLGEVEDRDDADAFHQGGLGGVGARYDDARATRRARGGSDREGAANRTHAAVERELARDRHAAEMVLQRMAGRGEECERDRQIVRGAFLAEVCRGEIHGDAAGRNLEAGVAERRADAILALPDARVGEPDRLGVGDAGREVDLDLHGMGVDADERAGHHGGEHRRRASSPAGCAATLRVSGAVR
jgi:hypothetical protein